MDQKILDWIQMIDKILFVEGRSLDISEKATLVSLKEWLKLHVKGCPISMLDFMEHFDWSAKQSRLIPHDLCNYIPLEVSIKLKYKGEIMLDRDLLRKEKINLIDLNHNHPLILEFAYNILAEHMKITIPTLKENEQ